MVIKLWIPVNFQCNVPYLPGKISRYYEYEWLNLIKNKERLKPGGWGHWPGNYTSPQSFITTLLYEGTLICL